MCNSSSHSLVGFYPIHFFKTCLITFINIFSLFILLFLSFFCFLSIRLIHAFRTMFNVFFSTFRMAFRPEVFTDRRFTLCIISLFRPIVTRPKSDALILNISTFFPLKFRWIMDSHQFAYFRWIFIKSIQILFTWQRCSVGNIWLKNKNKKVKIGI